MNSPCPNCKKSTLFVVGRATLCCRACGFFPPVFTQAKLVKIPTFCLPDQCGCESGCAGCAGTGLARSGWEEDYADPERPSMVFHLEQELRVRVAVGKDALICTVGRGKTMRSLYVGTSEEEAERRVTDCVEGYAELQEADRKAGLPSI